MSPTQCPRGHVLCFSTDGTGRLVEGCPTCRTLTVTPIRGTVRYDQRAQLERELVTSVRRAQAPLTARLSELARRTKREPRRNA